MFYFNSFVQKKVCNIQMRQISCKNPWLSVPFSSSEQQEQSAEEEQNNMVEDDLMEMIVPLQTQFQNHVIMKTSEGKLISLYKYLFLVQQL